MVMICLFKLDELSRMINNSLSQALDKIVAYESKDVIDRLNMFLVINLRFVLRKGTSIKDQEVVGFIKSNF